MYNIETTLKLTGMDYLVSHASVDLAHKTSILNEGTVHLDSNLHFCFELPI